MSGSFDSLPTEIILLILSHLSLKPLLAFGATSRLNYDRHILAFRHLRLAVFQRRVHSTISFLQAGWTLPNGLPSLREHADDGDAGYTVSVNLPPTNCLQESLIKTHHARKRSVRTIKHALDDRPQPRTWEEMVRIQSDILSSILDRYGRSLNHLEFMAYDLNNDAAVSLGKNCGPSLRHLALRFEHPHVRDGGIRPDAWFRSADPSTGWNALIGIGPYKDIGNITGLTTLTLERAGITPWQLRQLVKRNPGLRTLKMRTCNGAQPEFLYWLGGLVKDGGEDEEVLGDGDDGVDGEIQAPGAKLEVLWLDNCQQLLPDSNQVLDAQSQTPETCDRGLEWVKRLRNLKSISFSECTNIPSEYIETANNMLWHIPQVMLPYPLDQKTSSTGIIEPAE